MRSGKTMFATWLMHYYYDLGYTLYANYNLYNIPYIPIDSIEDFENVETPFNIYSVDEGWLAGLDSRRSQSFINVALSGIVLQSGKMGTGKYRKNNIIMTGQDFGQFDLRMRNVTDIIVKPTIIARDENEKPLAMIIDYIHYQEDRPKRKKLPIPLQFNFEHGFIDIPESYDTYQRIESMENDINPQSEIVQKYMDFEGTKTDLTTVLHEIEKYPITSAKSITNLIFMVKKGILTASTS